MYMLYYIVRGISCYGFVYSWWMYVYERMNSWICRRVINRCYFEVNVMEIYRVSVSIVCIYIVFNGSNY